MMNTVPQLSEGYINGLLQNMSLEEDFLNNFEQVSPSLWKLSIVTKQYNFPVFISTMNEPEMGIGISISHLSNSAVQRINFQVINEWNEYSYFTKSYLTQIHGTDFLALNSRLLTRFGVSGETLLYFIAFFCETWVPDFIDFLKGKNVYE